MPLDGAGAELVDLLALKVNREELCVVVAAAGVAPNLKGSVGAAAGAGAVDGPEPLKLNVDFFALLAPSSVKQTSGVQNYCIVSILSLIEPAWEIFYVCKGARYQ